MQEFRVGVRKWIKEHWDGFHDEFDDVNDPVYLTRTVWDESLLGMKE